MYLMWQKSNETLRKISVLRLRRDNFDAWGMILNLRRRALLLRGQREVCFRTCAFQTSVAVVEQTGWHLTGARNQTWHRDWGLNEKSLSLKFSRSIELGDDTLSETYAMKLSLLPGNLVDCTQGTIVDALRRIRSRLGKLIIWGQVYMSAEWRSSAVLSKSPRVVKFGNGRRTCVNLTISQESRRVLTTAQPCKTDIAIWAERHHTRSENARCGYNFTNFPNGRSVAGRMNFVILMSIALPVVECLKLWEWVWRSWWGTRYQVSMLLSMQKLELIFSIMNSMSICWIGSWYWSMKLFYCNILNSTLFRNHRDNHKLKLNFHIQTERRDGSLFSIRQPKMYPASVVLA